MLDFDRFPVTEGRSLQVSIYVPKSDVEMQIANVPENSTPVEFSLSKVGQLGEKQDQYHLKAKFPSGKVPSRFTCQAPAMVVLKMNREDLPELRLKVAYDAE